MMHCYRFRWAITGFLYVFLTWLFYWVVLCSSFEQLDKLEAEISVQQAKIAQLKIFAERLASQPMRDVGNVNATPTITSLLDVVGLIREYGLVLRTANSAGMVMTRFGKAEEIHLVLAGSLITLSNWLIALINQKNLIVVTDFSLLEQNQILEIDLKLLLINTLQKIFSGGLVPSLETKISFCNTEHEGMVANADDQAYLQQFFLSEMKLVGCLQKNQHKAALIRLPNGRVVEVNEGSRLGKEKALVTAISANRITYSLPPSLTK